MFKELNRIIKHTGIYGLGIVLSKAVGFLLIPLYTHYLKPADYGVLELLDLIVFLAGNFTGLGIFAAVFRFYAAYETEPDKREVISTAILFNAGVSLLVVALMNVFASPIAVGVFGSSQLAPLVRLVSFTLFFSNLTEIPFAYLRVRERTFHFVLLGLARTLVGATSMVIAVAVLQKGVVGAVYAGVISNALFGVATSIWVLRQVPRRIVPQKLKAMLSYGLPLVPWGLNMYVLTFSDRFFLRHFGTLADVGVYALGYKLAMVVTLLVTSPFSLLWQWHQFELAKHEDAKTIYARIQIYIMLASVFVGLGIALMAKDLLRVISPPSYWSGARIVPLIVMCYVLENVRSVVTSGILVQQATRKLMGISFIVIASNLLLNYLLISRFLAMGAAIATLLSYGLNLGLCYRAAQRVYQVHYEYGRNAIAIGSAVAIYLASQWVDLPLLASTLMNCSFLLLFVLVAVWLLNDEERLMFQKIGLSLASRMRAAFARAE